MLDILYYDIGSKIKFLAKVIFIVGVIAATITGFVFAAKGEALILIGIIVMIFGSIIALFFSWILYAFGELVEDIHRLQDDYTLQ